MGLLWLQPQRLQCEKHYVFKDFYRKPTKPKVKSQKSKVWLLTFDCGVWLLIPAVWLFECYFWVLSVAIRILAFRFQLFLWLSLLLFSDRAVHVDPSCSCTSFWFKHHVLAHSACFFIFDVKYFTSTRAGWPRLRHRRKEIRRRHLLICPL